MRCGKKRKGASPPNPLSKGRGGSFEEGGRTKEEGDVICGVRSEECGVWSENRIMRKGTGVSRKEKEGVRGNEIKK